MIFLHLYTAVIVAEVGVIVVVVVVVVVVAA